MRIKRCIYDIIYDLLSTLRDEQPQLKTPLCTASNLPLDRCSKLLGILLRYGLISEVILDNSRYYILSENGYIYLGIYEEMNRLLPLRSQIVS